MRNIMFYVTLNYPDEKKFFEILDLLKTYKFKYIEIGIPVTNPFMDGPLVRKTHEEVLANGLTPKDINETLKKVKNKYDFEVIIMTYYEGLNNYGLADFNDLYSGILCVDKYMTKNDIDKPVQIYPPNIEDNIRSEKIQNNEALAYIISGEGKTGTFNEVPDEYIDNLKFLKANSRIPVYVGFGIKQRNDIIKVLNSGADGVIIGTSFLKHYIDNGIHGLKEYIDSLI
ncbi:tryptophan synthase subunit alpha [Alkalibacterium sp. s-m-22]